MTSNLCNLRIGLGFDLHRLEIGRTLLLGGKVIPFAKGLSGHSDGDVLIHAVIDALLGAASLGDIGSFFPSDDPKYKDVSSAHMLGQIMNVLQHHNFEVVNIDCVLILEEPKLVGHYQAIKDSLAKLMGMEASSIGVKAKTAEQLGDIGAGKAIAAQAVALIKFKSL